jgi:hypothetical protein
MTSMPIIIKIGPAVMGVIWALIALLGVLLVSSGFFNTISGLTNFGKVALVNTAAISHISGGIVMFILGLVVVATGYLGIRGRIIITTSENTKNTPS